MFVHAASPAGLNLSSQQQPFGLNELSLRKVCMTKVRWARYIKDLAVEIAQYDQRRLVAPERKSQDQAGLMSFDRLDCL